VLSSLKSLKSLKKSSIGASPFLVFLLLVFLTLELLSIGIAISSSLNWRLNSKRSSYVKDSNDDFVNDLIEDLIGINL